MDPLRFHQSSALRHHPGLALRADAEEGKDGEEDGREEERDEVCFGMEEEDLTVEEELAEGDRHQREILEEYPLWPSTQARDQLQDCLRVLRSLGLRTDLTYIFAALDTPVPLASSCPNGRVYFSRGFLEHISPDEVLFFGAHEVAHGEHRHYATRLRRLGELRRRLPTSGATARQRMEQATLLAVRHLEEFEADFQAASWLDFPLGHAAMSSLCDLCRRVSPMSLQIPSHPSYPARLERLQKRLAPPDLLDYAYSLIT